mmetsp:Transcript_6955/g.23652  ORF Transcript_6955/g.23652 Transcript_6955/m.23652 type:complete len:214 (-) Transcript_6955:16-657(-)
MHRARERRKVAVAGDQKQRRRAVGRAVGVEHLERAAGDVDVDARLAPHAHGRRQRTPVRALGVAAVAVPADDLVDLDARERRLEARAVQRPLELLAARVHAAVARAAPHRLHDAPLEGGLEAPAQLPRPQGLELARRPAVQIARLVVLRAPRADVHVGRVDDEVGHGRVALWLCGAAGPRARCGAAARVWCGASGWLRARSAPAGGHDEVAST